MPGLYDAFGTDSFDSLYVDYESDLSIPRQTIGAQELILSLLKERAETGRIYIMNIDHCNTHSSFKDKVNMSNLCQEITLPTDPINHIDGLGEIALCILSAINVGKLKSLDELDELCELAVRGLDALIDYQQYPVKAAENSTKNRRSLGIGFIGLAHYLAKHGANYDSQKAHDLVHKLTERFQYALLTASNRMAMEKGPCGYFGKTKYADGILPIDTYKKDVDEIVPNDLSCDWEYLRGRIVEYGLSDTALCPHRCLQRAVPLCQTLPMESSLLATTCPLKNRRKDLLSRLCRPIPRSRGHTPSSGTCTTTTDTSKLPP